MSERRTEIARLGHLAVVDRAKAEKSDGRVQSVAQKRAGSAVAELLALPEAVMDAVQDMDPESETFGQFFFMLDYDPLP